MMVVVIATTSFVVHKTLSNILSYLLKKMEGIKGNIIGNYLKYQKSNPV